MVKRVGCIVCLILFVGGCATTGSIERNYALIDYSDGIDREEAILIAKKGLISQDPNPNLKYQYRITGPLVDYDEEENVWTVCFVPKYMVGAVDLSHLDALYCFDIDRASGEIVSRGKYPYNKR